MFQSLFQPRLKILSLAILASGIAAVASPGSTPVQLHYYLRLSRPTAHLVEVEITADKIAAAALDFMMPAWAPGRYAIYDFAKNVQEFEASGADGRALAWTKPDKQTWRVSARDGNPLGAVRARYRLFANDLGGSFSQFDASHANLNGPSIFMYVSGRAREPLALSIEAPAGWKILSGFSADADQRDFEARDYDHLVDTPLEISADGSLDEFREGGKTIRLALHSYAETAANRAKLLEGVRKVVHSEMAMMPAPDLDHYTFIVHFAPELALGDGMEHSNSTEIIERGNFDDGGIRDALEIAAHEFFHLWNVKRLRPAALLHYDYSRENYTPSLWFAEGVTSYYAFVHLLRSGLWSREEFLKRLAGEIRELETEPGRALMSAESSSFHAWFYDRSPQMQETNFANSTISYYNKGLVLALLLDLEVRSRTNGRKSLDDVLLALYHKFAADSDTGSGSAGGARRGYEENDILETLNAISASDFKSFFEDYVQGTAPLDYARTFALAGLELRVTAPPGAPPNLGVLTQRVDDGLRIAAVHPGGAADRGGLSRDDVLTEVDGLSLAAEGLDERLKIYPAGADVPFTVERHGKEERITVTLDPPEKNSFSIGPAPAATPAQVALREAWLGK